MRKGRGRYPRFLQNACKSGAGSLLGVNRSRTVRLSQKGERKQQDVSVIARVPALAPFGVRSFRFQWPADLLASWAFEMEGVILGWFVLVATGSVLALAIFGSLQFLGTLISPFYGMAGDRFGNRNLLCVMRITYIAIARSRPRNRRDALAVLPAIAKSMDVAA